jgi:Domain of unknown function (DUF4386)
VDDSRWERWSALGGAVFAVLIIVAGFLPGSPPKTSDSTAKIAKFVNDNAGAIRWQAFVGALATVALLWFLGAVWRVLRRAEGGNPRLTVVAVVGAVFAAVMGAVGSVMLASLGIVGAGGTGSPATLRFAYVLSTNLAFAVVVGVAVFLAAFSVVIVRTGAYPKWLGWVGILIALISVVAAAAVSSTRDVFMVLGFVAFLGSTLWLIVISILMMRSPGREPSTSAS